mgnify:CR=1 FL=1
MSQQNNNLISALLPFIEKHQVDYYQKLSEDKIYALLSIAPFHDSEELLKISKLEVDKIYETLQHI